MTDLGRIASAMGGEVHGEYAVFRTPGHSAADRGSWAMLKADAPDGVLIHSSNGGDPLAIKDELRAKGVLPERDGPNRRDEQPRWWYHDEHGARLYAKVRIDEPGRKYTLDRSLSKLGIAHVPYNLPGLLASVPGSTVYLVEGEKHADRLVSWGLTATSLKDWRRDFSKRLADRDVVILPDNDDTGREQAKAARDKLAGCKSIVTVALPGLPEGGDIIDWTGTADELRALVEAAMTKPDHGGLEPLVPLDIAGWQHVETPVREWDIADLVPRRQVTLCTGKGGVGKSLAMQQAATCIAFGEPFLGVETSGVPALYLTCEDDTDELHRRQKAICRVTGLSLAKVAERLTLVTLAGEQGNALASYDASGRLIPSARWRQIEALCMDRNIRFVVLDNLAHLMGGDLIDVTQVTAFINLAMGLAIRIDGSVVLLGHENRAGAEFFGSVAWENAVRSRLHICRDAEDNDLRHITASKANYSAGGKATSFIWYQGAVTRLEDLASDVGQRLMETTRATGDNELFLACLKVRNDQSRPVSEHKASRTYAPAEFAKMAESKGIGKARLEAALDRLFRINTIRRGVVCRIDRKDREGLLLVDPRCADLRADPALTPRADPRTVEAPTCAVSHLYTTYNEGQALGVPAPSSADNRSFEEIAYGDDDPVASNGRAIL